MLVQLRNGARIGEAIDAAKEFCESKGRAVSVRVVRIEKRKEGDTRLMVLPEELRGQGAPGQGLSKALESQGA